MQLATNPRHRLEPLYRELIRWDNNFSQAWGTAPTTEYVRAFEGVRDRTIAVAQELRTSPYDEVRPLGSTLERHADRMTELRSQLMRMAAQRTPFGTGWDRVLDQAISDVRYGLQLLGADPHPGPNPYPPQYPTPYPPEYPNPYPPQYPSPTPYPVG